VIPERVTVEHRVRVSSVSDVDHHHVPGSIPTAVQLVREGRGEVREGGVTLTKQWSYSPRLAEVGVDVVPNDGHVTVAPAACTLPVEGVAAGQQ
jgi:hypothetical protein